MYHEYFPKLWKYWGNIPKILEYFPTLEKTTKLGKYSQQLGKYSQIRDDDR